MTEEGRAWYSVFQYCPDRVREEFVNVGVLVCCPEVKYVHVEWHETPFRACSLNPIAYRMQGQRVLQSTCQQVTDLMQALDFGDCSLAARLKVVTQLGYEIGEFYPHDYNTCYVTATKLRQTRFTLLNPHKALQRLLHEFVEIPKEAS